MGGARVWFVLAAVAWCARAGPGPPQLLFERPLYNVTIPENSPPRTYAEQPPGDGPLGVRLPAPQTRVRFRIRHGDKDKFFKTEERTVGDFCFLSIRTRAGHADVLNRERRDSYRLEVRATAQLPGGQQLEADTVVAVSIADENDLSPLFYPTEYEVRVPEDAPLHSFVARVSAEDADLGLNGEIYYSLAEQTDRFAVHPTTGVVTLTRSLSAAESVRHDFVVLARDRASLLARGEDAPAAKASVVVRVSRVNLHPPELRIRRLPELVENSTAEIYAIVEVTDRDEGEHGRIAGLEIVDGDPDGHFRVRPSKQPGEYDVIVHALLDRETTPHGYNLTLRATDAGYPPRSSYLTLPVTLVDANDNAPVFSREVYEASIPETAPPNTPVIRLKVSDRDEGRNARVYIEIVGGNEGGEFHVNPDTGVLYTDVSLDAEEKAFYTLTVSAIDQGNAGTRKQSSAKVKISVLDSNDNDPIFERGDVEVTVAENGPSGAVVARVAARDADSGENAYISYSVANLQPVPFEVDHFSGAVRTTRLLDYESMRREYTLRIRASDWGLPYRRQTEMRLIVRLEDINDNRPQFERVDCVGYLPRKIPIGSEIITLSAIDFDAGDVVSYRIIGGNEDNCFSLDAGTGVLSLACDLNDVRADSRTLNVTATDGTHFADASSLSLHLVGGGGAAAIDTGALECRDTGIARRLTELLAAAERSNAPLDLADEFSLAPSRYGENLHSPEFIDFPVEVKVNESVALGTSLVRLKARDRDLGYNGLLVLSISGGDADSAFRIDPETGDLQVIGYLDRERESEYYLNVTVYDLGSPRRSSSRLLPITVLDVNDNRPRFEKTLASFRVTENALNGTAIFHANATDRDSGDFARISYSVSGASEGEFCINRETGLLAVCTPLDRERRALYELTVRATDGGGLHAEASVRVAVDDVNDNAPRFGLAAYNARVREDVPRGALVAVLEAFDPDLGAGGQVTYSLPDQTPEDAVFTVDPTSGTLRTARPLNFEERQVYGVTVRATDGGQPALWAEATVIVEVVDVDENRHSPVFSEHAVLSGGVREDAPRGTVVMRAAATDGDPPGRDSRLGYYIVAGSGMAHFSVDDTGVIRTLTPLDRESVPHYWVTLCAQDHGLVPRHSCVQVFVEVQDVNDMVPWPERASYAAAVAEQCAAGTRVARVVALDADASPRPPNITYAIVAGNPDGLFSIDETTGEIVTTGRALDREACAAHALEVQCSDGQLASTARVHVRLLDVNDHAPAFERRFYDVRVPAPPPKQMNEQSATNSAQAEADAGDETSTEWEGDDDDEAGGARAAWDLYEEPTPADVYVGAVLALDPDEGANGTVRYWGRARGAARRLLRVHAATGRIYAAPQLALAPGDAYDITVRACDAAPRPRCSVARARVRAVARGGGAAPALAAPPSGPLQAAELDAPGFLLTVLQATDPDGDPLYYDIIDGDPRGEFHLGREDGSLVLVRRLLWERQADYTLNVSVTDGVHVTTAAVRVAVANDADEGGVSFPREEYTLDASETARVGDALVALGARASGRSGGRLLYGVHATRAPASARLFRLHELSGVLELAAPLDRESAAVHELTVWARDQAPRASRAYARVTVRVHDADEHAPEWGRRLAEARVARTAPAGALVAALRAADPDAGEAARVIYSLAGGDAGGLFAVDPDLGDVRLERAMPAAGPRDYTVQVRASNPPPGARSSTLPLHVSVVEPEDAPPRFANDDLTAEVWENEPAGTAVAALEAGGAWLSLEGGAGLFRLNPAAGLLSTAAPLDYEACDAYNLTVTAVNMGGGTATARVTVHVLDRNEFPPTLRKRSYRGRVSEAAPAGALVADADAVEPATPLVLAVDDADSPANRQRAYEILDPDAATLFRVDATTGALRLAAPLDYELAARHRFTVRVIDTGTPRTPSRSVATVDVDVADVNDCPPEFSRPTYSATVLLPTSEGVVVTTVAATDPDLPGDGAIKYDVIEGDASGAFALSAAGVLRVARPDAVAGAHRLRVRASDGLYSSTARVEVAVREADNSGLAFQKPDYYASLMENSTKVATIAVLNVLGAALNEHLHFRILNPVEGFEVGPTSGAVRSTGVALDRELRDAYTLLVEARSEAAAGAEARVARTRVHITVTDVNDNCPVFVGRPYAAAVLAGAEPGATVLTVRAVDLDANDNGEVRYEMKRGHGELFRVERRTGRISLKQTVDGHNRLYSLVIAAFDGGVPACAAEAPVTVRVWGGGAAPSWERAHYALEAREDSPPGAPLGPPLRALSPLNRQLIYTLVDESRLFELHFDTAPDRGNSPCVLVASAPLDYERAAEHALVVRATDGVTGAYADVAVTLRVLDVNDCAPEFPQDVYHVSVSEAAPPGHLVIALRATDADTGLNGEVSYSVSAADGAPEAAFTVDARTGELHVAEPLDRETIARYHLSVTATDGGRPALLTTAHVFIEVEDVNDSPPRVERAVVPALVSAEAARGTALARVAAWDPDERDAPKLRFALEGAAPQRAFSIDARSGVISLANTRAWPEAAAPRSLNVSVSDGAHAAFARVKLSLAAANRAPPRFPHLVYEARALENQPPPLLLTTVKAYDDDGGEYGTVTYSIPSARLRETFAVDSRTGALSTRVPLDREARAEWEVPVTASDGGGLLRHTAVRVRVADLNDNAPAFPLREYRAAVRCDRAPRAPFLTLTARDPDAGENARLAYSVYEGEARDDAAAGLFAVDAHTGALSFARDPTAFASRVLQVWVRARDSGGLAAEAPVSVYVLGAGEAPPRVQPPPADLFLPEDAPPGTLIAELRAPDAVDATDETPSGVRYRLAGALWPRDLFAVEGDRLVLAGQLDRETASEHIIGIIAEGSGSPAPAILVQTRLHVLDVNEHAPAFHSQPYVVHVAENTPPQSSLVRLMADDPDAGSNGEVRFSLAEEGDGSLFAVDPYTGWVSTVAPLDREARSEHRLTVLASDGAARARVSRGTVVVRLVDYNDCPPVFARGEYSAEVREDAVAGTVVARLEVGDADASGAPLAFFVAGGDARARFQVRASGEVFVARALDRETDPRYELTVAATDGKFTAFTRVLVAVLDVNDNPPYCVRHRYSVRLSEDAPLGAPVATLETGDADEPGGAQFRFYLTGESAHHFAIDKESGAIAVAQPLDREARALYRLRAHAQDRERTDWECSSELLVALDDVNDNAPRFSAALYSVTLPEDAETGTLVAKVHAVDADLGENRAVRYSLEEETEAEGVFALAPDSGIVTLRAALDREARAEHRAVVRATDRGSPPLSATATLRLTVADVNDNPPEFEFHRYRAAVPELDAVGTEVLRVRATSRDAGVNADVYYSLVGGDDRDDFAVDRSTGALTVARPLDYERRTEYLLTVQATDGGAPPLSDLATVNVTVVDGNDNAPAFAQPSYGVRVREDAAVGTRVLQLIADDADSGANGRVAYSIARGDRDGRFAIDPDTGYLSVAAPLDRETTPSYALEVRARDRGTPALEASAAVDVEVVDANDNPPLFAQTNYTAVVREDRPLGHSILRFVVEDADAPPNGAPYTFDFQSGNEMGAFRLEQDGHLRSAMRFNHRIKDRYALQVRVFDNGTPPLYSDAWVHVRVVEESQYPPAVTPLEVVVNSYMDEFPGGAIGRVFASDRDPYDTLAYALAPVDGAPYAPTDLFEIDPAQGTLHAAPRLDVGEYRLNVTVGDGKFLGYAIVRVAVTLVSDEMLAQAVVVRFREVAAADFVLGHRKGFLRSVAEATDREPPDVVLVGVQPSDEVDAEEPEGGRRSRRQVARDLDVAFAVRSPEGFVPADALRRRLHAHLERIEKRARLVVEELVRASCGGCGRGACVERVAVRAATVRTVATDVFALVAPPHRVVGECACEAGFGGERCDVAAGDCGECRAPAVALFGGDGYLAFRVERGAVAGARPLEDELVLSLRFRTRRERGTLAAAAGRVDYAALEVVDGYLQFRMELGSGPAQVRAAVPVADGAWHEARLERRGAAMRLTVDRRSALAQTPPPAAVLDARPDRLLVGAELQRHAHAFAAEQVTYGFHGCISDLKLDGVALPLEEGGTSSDGRMQLVRRVRVRTAGACPPLAPPTPCASYPCLNGGTCRETPDLLEGAEGISEGYACACHPRFAGRRCEVDTDPCASQPCLHGGSCRVDAGAFRCTCAAGLSGERCERGRWCGADAEGAAVCAHGGACEEGEWGPSCRCRGYYGPRCQFDVDECAGEPCLNGATCLNEPGSFRCLCPPDKTGMNCGNPLYSDAVVAVGAGGGGAQALAGVWRWACDARWPLACAGALLALLVAVAIALPLSVRGRRARALARAHAKPHEVEPLKGHALEKLPPRASKLSNLEAVRRERPASCAEPPPLNNVDTLRSYGSAGDELEGIPPDYRRNLNINTDGADRKPWSEQMHLHTFVDNKIYNDLKGCKSRPPRRQGAPLAAAVGAEPHLVGGYHWDCSDWCGGGGALPGISEVAGSERPDSSSPASPPTPPAPATKRAPRPPRFPPPFDTDSAPDDLDFDGEPPRTPDASSYLLHPDAYLPRAASDSEAGAALSLREPDASSLITMLEERNSLLGGVGSGSGSELSAHLCEIEDSDAEEEEAAVRTGRARHTDV